MFEHRPPITRVRSSRLTKKVSCETLILSNIDCKLPCNTQNIHFSDDDLRIVAGSNAREEQHVHNDPNLANCLENPSHRNRNHPHENPLPAIGRQRTAFAQLLRKVSLCECNMSDAIHPGRKRKPPRTFPSAVHRSSGLLPHSGTIILPIRSRSGSLNNMSSKAPVLLKASSLIPSNAVAGEMSALVIKDPSSPKVTCLGRVRIKQQGCKQSGKPTAVVLDDGKGNKRHPACLVTYLMRKEKKSGNVKAYRSPMTHQERRGLGFSVNMLVADDCVDGSKGMTTMAKCTTEEGKFRCISKKESKQWSRVKIMKGEEMNDSDAYEQKQQIAQDVSPLEASYSEAEVCMNLNRLASVKSQQQLASSSSVADRSQRFENIAGKESISQAPPRDALLLMRNSRPKNLQRRLEQDGDNTHIMQEPLQKALLTMKSSKCKGSYMGGSRCTSSSELWSAQETSPSAASNHYGVGKVVNIQLQSACDKPPPSLGTKTKFSKMWEPSSSARKTQNSVFCQPNKSGIYRQASLPNAQVSLWQRRAVRKLYALDIRRPSQSESKHPNTT